MAAFLTEWLPAQLISCRCSRLYLAIQSDPICWNAKKLKKTEYTLQNISQQPAFCVALQTIIEHFQFPSLCNAVTLMRNASQPIEFNLIKSQRFNWEISFLHNMCYLSCSMFGLKKFFPIVRFFGPQNRHFGIFWKIIHHNLCILIEYSAWSSALLSWTISMSSYQG